MDKPIILLKGKYSEETLAELKKKNRVWKTIDIYKNQLGEVFQITHPRLLYSSDYDKEKENFVKAKLGKNPSLKGNWIYFPWSGFLIHTVGQKDYLTLRTNRNRNLITKKEQEKLYDFCVGIAGLSIGNMIAVSLAYQGFSTFKLAELDTLETTNLNRIRTGIGSLGMRKIDITAQQIYEIDPHAKLYLFNRGLKKNNFKNFFEAKPQPNVVFDENDDFEIKVSMRLAARISKIPVIMLTNLGDSVLVDVERYDENPQLPLFNGRIGNFPEKILKKKISKEEVQKIAVGIVGVQNIPLRALLSVKEVGKTLVGRPQLASTVTISSGLAVFLVRKIALRENLPSGRVVFKFEDLVKMLSK